MPLSSLRSAMRAIASGMRRPPARSRARVTVALVCAALASGWVVAAPTASAVPACAAGAMAVVAHEDDDTIFLNPDILRDIQAGRCVRTVYTTAGDAGGENWPGRELGAEAAYAQMAGVANQWTTSDADVAGHPIRLRTLVAAPHISLVFLRLPDGLNDGSGSTRFGNQSIQRLRDGALAAIDAIDGSTTYTRAQLTASLAALMAGFTPTTVRTQDYLFGAGDNSDHVTTGLFVADADPAYSSPHTLTFYLGYGTHDRPQNLFGDDLTEKQAAFLAYGQVAGGPIGDGWTDAMVKRDYITDSRSTGNLARGASVTASAQNTGTGQTADRAIDGYAVGSPIDATHEWATGGAGSGSWIQVDFGAPTQVNGVALADRPNAADQITAGTLEFSDGSTVSTGPLPNRGSMRVLSFPTRTVTSVRLRIDATSPTTTDVGLAEFEVYGNLGGGATTVVVADAGVDQTVTAGTTVTLEGGALSQDGAPVTYAWSQIAGPAVSLSSTSVAQPTFTAPAAGSAVTFRLVASTDLASSAPATVTVTSVAHAPANLSRAAGTTTSASSQADWAGQTAAKAADGVIDANDYTHEWATNGGKVGSWWQATFTGPMTVDHVVLADRPNSFDQATSLDVVFADGSRVPVGALPNDGTPLTVTFDPRATTWVRIEVTGVSSMTGNVGLAEAELWGIPTPPETPATAHAGADFTAHDGQSVTLPGSGYDPLGRPLTYVWSQTSGPAVTLSSTTAPQPTFTAPAAGATLRFALRVNNGVVDSAPDTVEVTITPNAAPVANAGPASTVAFGSVVTLAGSGADADGDALTYQWTQVGGPTVSLAGATTARPTFTAPASVTDLTFSLTVSDGLLVSPASTVTVTTANLVTNLARTQQPSVTASSDTPFYGQTAAKAVDGVVDDSDYTHEWATNGGHEGSWWQADFVAPVRVDHVVLSDRPNAADQVTAGTLVFSDGTQVPVGALPNNGAGLTVSFPPVVTSSVRLLITSVSSSTLNVGLAEFEIWGSLATPEGTNVAPVADAGTTQSVSPGAAVTLAGSGTDANGDPLTYTWTQTSGTTVTLAAATTAHPTFTAPTAAGTLTFSLVVNDGTTNSTPATVTVTIANLAPVADAGTPRTVLGGTAVALAGSGTDANGDPLTYTWTQTGGTTVRLSSRTVAAPTFTAPTTATTLTFSLVVSDGRLKSPAATVTVTVVAPSNLALLPGVTATASSANAATGQTAAKAIDGVLSSTTTAYEWVTVGGRAGSWWQATLAAPSVVNRVVLYDRPNTIDRITAATLQFSDGSTVSVGALPNAGTALTVSFTPRQTTWVRLTVTTVSATTTNVGLAEMQIWGMPAP